MNEHLFQPMNESVVVGCKPELLDESIHDIISKHKEYLDKSAKKFGEKFKSGIYKTHALAKKYPNDSHLANAKQKLVNFVKGNLHKPQPC